ASLMSNETELKGRVVLLFQPAEENGSGAGKVLEDPKFKEIEPDYAFALHNLPGFSKNLILCKSSYFTASVISLEIELTGKETHAGLPERGINPVYAAAEIIGHAKQMQNTDSENLMLITPVHL